MNKPTPSISARQIQALDKNTQIDFLTTCLASLPGHYFDSEETSNVVQIILKEFKENHELTSEDKIDQIMASALEQQKKHSPDEPQVKARDNGNVDTSAFEHWIPVHVTKAIKAALALDVKAFLEEFSQAHKCRGFAVSDGEPAGWVGGQVNGEIESGNARIQRAFEGVR